MTRVPARLQLLNLLRWFREYSISWGLLSVIYSVTATMILQPLLEQAFQREIHFAPLWFLTCATLLVPGVIESIGFPPVPWLVRRGKFKELPVFMRTYLRHEFRRGSTWIAVLGVVIGGMMLPDGLRALWIMILLLPSQRALYSVHRWRRIAQGFLPSNGGVALVDAFTVSQLVQFLVAWGAFVLSGVLPLELAWKYGVAGGCAVIAASSVALEGDSGRPWLVNFFSLAVAVLAGYLVLAFPAVALAVLYFRHAARSTLGSRLKSVEHLDEDSLVP